MKAAWACQYEHETGEVTCVYYPLFGLASCKGLLNAVHVKQLETVARYCSSKEEHHVRCSQWELNRAQ